MVNISVIMLTYNRENLVSKAIDSILSQTFSDFEFIIVDNGSTDSSGEIIDEYAKKDSRIYTEHIKKSSISAGRNCGLKLAKGKYITFIDDDDIACHDMLEFLFGLAEKNNADISLCGSYKIINQKVLDNYVFNQTITMSNEEAVIELLKREKMSAGLPTKMIRKKLFEQEPFHEHGMFDDIAVTYRYYTNANMVVASGKPKYYIMRHKGNHSAFTENDCLLSSAQLKEYFNAFNERTKFLTNSLPAVKDFAQYSEWSYLISMCNKIESNHLWHLKEELIYIKDILRHNYQEFYFSPYIQDFEKKYMEKYIRKEFKK